MIRELPTCRWPLIGIALGVALMLAGCSSGNDNGGNALEQKCRNSITPYIEAAGADLVQSVEEEADEGVLSRDEIQSAADLRLTLIKAIADAALEKCTTDPQAALNALCNSGDPNYNVSLWQDEWCR